MNSRIIKTAKIKKLNVVFAEVRGGEVVYRDSIHADSVEQAIANRFGTLPAGFVVEKIIELK